MQPESINENKINNFGFKLFTVTYIANIIVLLLLFIFPMFDASNNDGTLLNILENSLKGLYYTLVMLQILIFLLISLTIEIIILKIKYKKDERLNNIKFFYRIYILILIIIFGTLLIDF